MIRLMVVRIDHAPYTIPNEGDTVSLLVAGDGEPNRFIEVQAYYVDPDWAPDGVIRVEGVTEYEQEVHGFIAQYRTGDTEHHNLGILEIQT